MTGRRCGLCRGGTCPALHETGVIALRQNFDGLWHREHAALSGEQGLDPIAQAWPIGWRQIELAAEIEERELADLFSGAFGPHKTERDIGFAIGLIPGRGFTDEHGVKVGLAAGGVNGFRKTLWHYK